MQTVQKTRDTRYCRSIRQLLQTYGHATNTELLLGLRQTYPAVSATTVHRATTRLAQRGEIRLAPSAADGALRYDANTTTHDHFMCTNCGQLKDARLSKSLLPAIEQAIGDGCRISGDIVVRGLCKHCALSLAHIQA